jgi:hypothetical protein
MTDHQPNAEAIEKAAEAIAEEQACGSCADPAFICAACRNEALAALSAAYPALRAQIIRELAEGARGELSDLYAEIRAGNAHPDDATDLEAIHRWLRARHDTKETP